MKSGMVVNINSGKASNIQAPFGLIGTTGPIPAYPGCFLPGFADITGIKGNGISPISVSKCELLIKYQEIKLLFKLLSVYLFFVFTVPC